MRYSHRFFLYAPVAAVVALAVGVSVYWYVAANAFASRLEALNGHVIAPGVTLHFNSKSIGGFPFRVDAVLENLRLDVAAPGGPASWTAEHFALHMLDYAGSHLILEAAGKQTFAWRDSAGAAHGFSFTPALLRASTIGSGGRLARFDIELYGAQTPALGVAHTELHFRRDPDADALDVVVMADDVHVAPTFAGEFGKTISKFRLKGTLAPAGEWNALLAGRRDWRSAAEAWRAHSGALDISDVEIAWGKADVKGAGTLRLDGVRRPTGLIKLNFNGARALAEAAKSSRPGDSEKGLFAGLAAEAAAAKPDVPLPVTVAFKDGLAYVADTPVGFVAPLY